MKLNEMKNTVIYQMLTEANGIMALLMGGIIVTSIMLVFEVSGINGMMFEYVTNSLPQGLNKVADVLKSFS